MSVVSLYVGANPVPLMIILKRKRDVSAAARRMNRLAERWIACAGWAKKVCLIHVWEIVVRNA